MSDLDVLEPETADDAAPAEAESADGTPAGTNESAPKRRRWRRLRPSLAYLAAPVLVLLLALGVGYLKWQAASLAAVQEAGAAAVPAATETTIAMLSYRADHVAEDLTAASERLTGAFRDEYTALINDVVIPGAVEDRISAQASVPAAALVSASADRAEVLVYINQTTTIGDEAPTESISSARVLLQKVDGRWLVSGFEPI